MTHFFDTIPAIPVIPVLVVEQLAHAKSLAEALVAGGLPVLEVTLRTPVALDVIREMAKVPGAIVGAGTVMSAKQMQAAVDAGATFAVSPGFLPELHEAAQHLQLPWLPGVATATEVMTAYAAGLRHCKFFPAEQAGGTKMLSAFASPFAQMRFCPTGGVTEQNYHSYLNLPNVHCVGGSWLTPKQYLTEQNWEAVKAAALAVSK